MSHGRLVFLWEVKCDTNLGEQDVKFGLCEPPPNARSASVPERKRHERVDSPSCRQRTFVSLEPSLGQEVAGSWEVLCEVAHYEMREYDVRLREKKEHTGTHTPSLWYKLWLSLLCRTFCCPSSEFWGNAPCRMLGGCRTFQKTSQVSSLPPLKLNICRNFGKICHTRRGGRISESVSYLRCLLSYPKCMSSRGPYTGLSKGHG